MEVFSLTREYSMDVVTSYLYGIEKGTNWIGHPAEASYHLSAFLDALEPWAFFASTEIQRLVSVFSWFGVNLISPSVNTAFDTIHSFVLDLTTRAVSPLLIDHVGGNGSTGMIGQVWQRLDNIPEEPRTRLIASDIVDQIHAGHEATGTVLTYLMWELSRNPAIQDRLHIDLISLSNPRSSDLLDAVLMETIRLYPAGFGPFPRVAPANASVKGFPIPIGTIASASPYTLGRNCKVFPDPDLWLPERWLKASPEEKRQMRQLVWMFMSGQRICIGEHLAILGK